MSIPSRGDILDYWKEWLDRMDRKGFYWWRPSCWACGCWWGTEYDVEVRSTWKEIRNAWNKAPLQRCHIIPKSLGGYDEPSNLFLMCMECHDMAPNTTSREAFFEWVKHQNWIDRRWKVIKNELETFGFDTENAEEMDKLEDVLLSKEFRELVEEKAGIHFSQSGYGSRITTSTIAALLWKHIKKGNEY